MRTKAYWLEDRADFAEVAEIEVTDEPPASTDGKPVAIVEGIACGPNDMPGELIVAEMEIVRQLRFAGFKARKGWKQS
jgi:hypothetical protein